MLQKPMHNINPLAGEAAMSEKPVQLKWDLNNAYITRRFKTVSYVEQPITTTNILFASLDGLVPYFALWNHKRKHTILDWHAVGKFSTAPVLFYVVPFDSLAPRSRR